LEVEYSRLGKTGLQVSRICLGMMSFGTSEWQSWVLPEHEGVDFVRLALERGINFFDTANFYSTGGSERALGDAIKQLTDRENVVIGTKVGLPMGDGLYQRGLSRKHIMREIDGSLKRLRTDYIDLYQLHFPDYTVEIDETVDALNDVVRAGKALYVGVSNHPMWRFAPMFYSSLHRHGLHMSAVQLQYNLAFREDERDLLPFCETQGIGVTVYSPLARGWLAGNRAGNSTGATAAMSAREKTRAAGDLKAHATYGSDDDLRILDRLLEVSKARGLPPSRVAMSWLLSKSAVTSILCGALEPAHIEEAVNAVDLKLTPDEIAALEEPYRPQTPKDVNVPIVPGGKRFG
jgi:aryl-alcohol dehydrogenase-like predicted oxidoreductase